MAAISSSSNVTVLERQQSWLNWQQLQQRQGSSFYDPEALRSLPVKFQYQDQPGGLNAGWPDVSASGYTMLGSIHHSTVKYQETSTTPTEHGRSGGSSGGARVFKKRKAEQSPAPNLDSSASKQCSKENKSKVESEVATATEAEHKSKDNGKAAAPPKTEYIHVRARRGQATDSHSLAERVRREKISERMRYLQDLVPGCNKIIGKAGMLDEIINYVQSLQRQVEFLSMKLAAVSPTRMDFNLDNFFSKEMTAMQCGGMIPGIGMSPEMVHPSCFQFNLMQQDSTNSTNRGLDLAPSSSDAALRRTASAPLSMPEQFLDSCFNIHRPSSAWDTDLNFLYNIDKSSPPFQLLQGNILPNNPKMGT